MKKRIISEKFLSKIAGEFYFNIKYFLQNKVGSTKLELSLV